MEQKVNSCCKLHLMATSNEMPHAIHLKKQLKQCQQIPEELAIRLHRSISWLSCFEENEKNPDVGFLSLWISFNACYGVDAGNNEKKTERERFKKFIDQLVQKDESQRIFNLLWNKFSGPVKMLIDNHFVFKTFWDFHRGEAPEWETAFRKSQSAALHKLSEHDVAGLLEIVLDRLYVLRNQVMHGGATYKSKLNRSQIKDGVNMLRLLVPVIIEIMLQNPEEDWGEILYPVITN